jgi:hypothetical protein
MIVSFRGITSLSQPIPTYSPTPSATETIRITTTPTPSTDLGPPIGYNDCETHQATVSAGITSRTYNATFVIWSIQEVFDFPISSRPYPLSTAFQIHCDKYLEPRTNHILVSAYTRTFTECMNLCVNYNFWHQVEECRGVSYSVTEGESAPYSFTDGEGQCFVKSGQNYASVPTREGSFAAALLIV